MRALARGCGVVLVLTSTAACTSEDEGPTIASGLPRPLAGVYDDFGPAPGTDRFRALMAFPTRDVAGLERAIDEMYDPKHPSFRKYMTPDTWIESYAPAEADLAAVESWLATNGMTREHTSKNRLMFQFSGTVAQFNSTFKTELRAFERENPSLGNPPISTYGSLTSLKAPQNIVDLVEGVVAVDVPADTKELPPEGGDIVETPLADAEVVKARTPAQIAHAYGLDGLYAAGHHGEGVKLGLVIGATYKIKDLQSFWRSFGISRDNPKHAPTAEPIATRYLESTLDVEWAGGMAPAADLIAYEGPDARNASILFAFTEAVASGEVSVLSTSFAHREETEAEAIRIQYNDSARMGAALGMTIVVASGDSSMPDVPSSSPYVTCVGGTVLKLGANGEVASEEAWSGSGSGLARSFPRPAWQKGTVKDNGGQRAVSDVAMNASPESEYWLYFLAKWDHRGGTSFAAPAFAGLMAVVNSYRVAKGAPVVGWLNPALYNEPAVQAAFRDVTVGKTPFYPSGPGWDYPTGWGAPLADKLAPAFP